MRAVRVPFSPARPSRLKKLPGILPAAYIRSSTSTVSGRKSTSRRFPAVAVPRTIVSPARTTTAPLACLASFPVSNVISVPPTSTETRCACALTSFMLFLSAPPPVGGNVLWLFERVLGRLAMGLARASAIRAPERVFDSIRLLRDTRLVTRAVIIALLCGLALGVAPAAAKQRQYAFLVTD